MPWLCGIYLCEGCLESIQPFWISQEPVTWPWCNLAANQRRPYCASVKSHSPVGLVSRQWDAIDWACVPWPSHSQWPSEHINFIMKMHLPILQLSWRLFFGKASHNPGLSAPLQPRFGSLQLLAFPTTKIAVQREDICECVHHTAHKLSQQRLTADWLAPWESDCSWMHSKVSSEWLPSYIKATRPVLEIFKMDGYFPYSPRTL